MATPKSDDTTVQQLAAAHAARAIEVLAEVMESEFSEPKDRISAAEKLLDRSQGKPAQAVIVAHTVQRQKALAYAKTDEELMAIIEQKQLPSAIPRQAMVTIEAPASTLPTPSTPSDGIGFDGPLAEEDEPFIDPMLR